MALPGVDRISITTVVDNYIDSLRQDGAVVRRFSPAVARKMPDLRAEHGLAHLVEVVRGAAPLTILFDFGLTADSLNHNLRELSIDPRGVDAIALSHGHRDHFGGLLGFLHTYRTLVVNLKDRGLVVVTSCSHRGIVGICRHATRMAGVAKIHAVIGGFHLSGLSEERIGQVVDAFRAFDIDYVVPQHCTGIEAIAALLHRLPGKVVVSSVGSTFTWGAPGAPHAPQSFGAPRSSRDAPR